MRYVVSQTADGPRCIAPGVCAVCGWRGWAEWDIGLRPVASEPNTWVGDADPVCDCPNCTLNEVAVYPGASHDSLQTLPDRREEAGDVDDDGEGVLV